MKLVVKSFEELTVFELYEILKSRANIFQIEQGIHYLDMDDIDLSSLHCFFMDNDKVTAYLRAFYKDENKNEIKIGRVLTLKHGNGTGSRLLSESIPEIMNKMKCTRICIDAQKTAVEFYKKAGFIVTSDEFLEEGIVHVKMELANS